MTESRLLGLQDAADDHTLETVERVARAVADTASAVNGLGPTTMESATQASAGLHIEAHTTTTTTFTGSETVSLDGSTRRDGVTTTIRDSGVTVTADGSFRRTATRVLGATAALGLAVAAAAVVVARARSNQS